MSDNTVSAIKKLSPVDRVYRKEYMHHFLSFCSLACMSQNKKLNLANIFLLMLRDPDMLTIFKDMCEIDSNYEALKKFLEYDATLHKSKYIKNFLSENNFKLKS
jgi:hypothetical protein